jgi:hypothetical protein
LKIHLDPKSPGGQSPDILVLAGTEAMYRYRLIQLWYVQQKDLYASSEILETFTCETWGELLWKGIHYITITSNLLQYHFSLLKKGQCIKLLLLGSSNALPLPLLSELIERLIQRDSTICFERILFLKIGKLNDSIPEYQTFPIVYFVSYNLLDCYFHILALTTGNPVYLISTKGARRPVWPFSRGCLLLCGTWPNLLGGLCCPTLGFVIAFWIMITFYTLLKSPA